MLAAELLFKYLVFSIGLTAVIALVGSLLMKASLKERAQLFLCGVACAGFVAYLTVGPGGEFRYPIVVLFVPPVALVYVACWVIDPAKMREIGERQRAAKASEERPRTQDR